MSVNEDKLWMKRVEYRMESGTHLSMDLRTEPRTLACTLACMDSGKERSTEGQGLLPTRNGRCPLGYSRLQIGIISVLKATSGTLSYWQIAEEVQRKIGLQVTEGAIRGALERLFKQYDFLIRNRSTKGRLKGNTYSFAAEPCPHIRTTSKATLSSMESFQRLAPFQQPSKSREIERENLSVFRDSDSRILALTDADIALHWPKLATSGFGTAQLEQIIAALRKLGKSSEHVLEGLTRAEWELERGIMIDREKKVVDSPNDYVFRALARNGDYRVPRGYISREEMADQEAAQEAERCAKARQERIDAEYEAWWVSLNPEDVRKMLPSYTQSLFGAAAKAMLKPHFREHIWPEILAAKSLSQPTPCAHGALSGAGRGLCPSEPREGEDKEPKA